MKHLRRPSPWRWMFLPFLLVILALTMDVLMVVRAMQGEGPATIPLGPTVEENAAEDDLAPEEPAP